MIVALFGFVLIVHGLVHLSWLAPQPDDPGYPFRLTDSAIFRRADPTFLARVGGAFVLVSTIALVLAGLGVLGVPGLAAIWRPLAVIGAAISLVVVATFWHRWFLIGPLLDVAIIVAAVLGWPKP